jgi:diguanylate cyclase (GGDEF)-like protein/PAS domain S-box-containing protein
LDAQVNFERVLLIDDNGVNTNLIEQELQNNGARVQVELVSTLEAMNISLNQQLPDLVVCNCNLSAFSSLDAFDQFKQHQVNIPFVLISGDSINEQQAIEGGWGFVKRWGFVKKNNPICLAYQIGCVIGKTNKRQLQKEIKQSLENTEMRLSHLLNSSPSVVYSNNNANGHYYTFISDNVKNILGYKPEEMQHNNVFWENHLHPDDIEYIKNEIKNNLKDGGGMLEYRFRNKSNHYVWLQDNFKVIYENGKLKQTIGLLTDVTSTYELKDKLTYQESHDDLTRLVNRKEFETRLKRLISTAIKDDAVHILCYLDLDQFWIVNDTYGHLAGDELLRQLSATLKKELRENDTLARLDGDGFGILLENCPLHQSQNIADTVLNSIKSFRLRWNRQEISVDASIGIVEINKNSGTTSTLMVKAYDACYVAKTSGRNRVHVYDDDVSAKQAHGAMHWVSRIKHALEHDRFCLYFQTIKSLSNNSNEDSIEILLRMLDEHNKIIEPIKFLPAVERYNLSIQVDCWVIEAVFSWLSKYKSVLQGVNYVAINLSGYSMTDDETLNFIKHQFVKYKIPCAKICFEITETAAVSNLSSASAFMSELKKLGCRFSLDDFGSGMSSFAYLKNLPVDILKIDGLFVKNISQDPIDCAMVKSINEIGHVMGKKTVAEYVENDESIRMLKELNVDCGQGYGIARPKPIAELVTVMGNVVYNHFNSKHGENINTKGYGA